MIVKAPFVDYVDVVRPEWVDYNGHMNVAFYGYVFEEAARAFFAYLDLSRQYRERSGHGFFAVEAHTIYEREVKGGGPLAFTSQILGVGNKTIHCLHAMLHADERYVAATNEVMYVNVNIVGQRSAPIAIADRVRLRELFAAHLTLPQPPQAGRAIRPRGQGA